jgi:enoyl-CoA hydratase/carnithine racemase
VNDAVTIEAVGPVRVLTLNRPDTLNAFDDDLHAGLPAALRQVELDREARVIVLTGAGRAFSAGGDIEDFERFADDLELRRRSLRTGRQLFEDLVNVHLPVIAAVNGPAVGLGCTIASACDFVLVSDKAFLADPHVQVALVAGDGGAVTFPLSVGLLRAKQYLLTGDRIAPEVAVELGLATRVVPAGSLLDEALALAHKIAALPPQAVQDTKAVLNQHLRLAAVATLGFGLAAESQSHDTAEYRAVPGTFRARRD